MDEGAYRASSEAEKGSRRGPGLLRFEGYFTIRELGDKATETEVKRSGEGVGGLMDGKEGVGPAGIEVEASPKTGTLSRTRSRGVIGGWCNEPAGTSAVQCVGQCGHGSECGASAACGGVRAPGEGTGG